MQRYSTITMVSGIVKQIVATSAASGRIEVPLRCTMGRGVDTRIDYLKDDDKLEVYSLFKSAASRGEGMSKDQFQTQEEVDGLIALGINFCVKDMGNSGKLIGFLNIYPSPLCRSNVPLAHSGRKCFQNSNYNNVLIAVR